MREEKGEMGKEGEERKRKKKRGESKVGERERMEERE